MREVTLLVGVKRDQRGKRIGSPSYPENEQQKQRPVTWSGQAQVALDPNHQPARFDDLHAILQASKVVGPVQRID